MAYLINDWKFNEIRKYNHKHSNVSQQQLLGTFEKRAPRQTDARTQKPVWQ